MLYSDASNILNKKNSLIRLVVIFMGTYKYKSPIFLLVSPLNVVTEGCLTASVKSLFPHIEE